MNPLPAYAPYHVYYGDIHNHCDISYGHGSIEDAYANAQLQLDFASVTGHAWWHDMPPASGRLKGLVEYHQRGFAHLDAVWEHVQDVTEHVHQDGRFVSFLSFEWHSSAHGDHCFYYKDARGEIIRAANIKAMRLEQARLQQQGVDSLIIPHHICYLNGYRGINWDDFDPQFTPVVEMMSMHGCGEHDDAPRPYLHSMGPRDARSSLIAGLQRGHRFGIIGSSDHHAAHPGSHGHGRMAVWAKELTRDGIWSAIQARRTFALTGDRIELAFVLNGAAMGSDTAATDQRDIQITVCAESPLDYIDIVRNGNTIHRYNNYYQPNSADSFVGTVGLQLGWGEGHDAFDWVIEMRVENGRIIRPLPRFKGDITVSPQRHERGGYHISNWQQIDDETITFRTRTEPNANVFSDSTQGFGLEIEGGNNTQIHATINGHEVVHSIAELLDGPRSNYIDGFVSPAYQFTRAVPQHELNWQLQFTDIQPAQQSDWYYIRVRQKNDQWAWSSPIFVG